MPLKKQKIAVARFHMTVKLARELRNRCQVNAKNRSKDRVRECCATSVNILEPMLTCFPICDFSSSWSGLFAEEFQEIEEDVKNYLGTLRRSMKQSHLKMFMEQLSGKFHCRKKRKTNA